MPAPARACAPHINTPAKTFWAESLMPKTAALFTE
jgi:hypothetical protein